MKATDEQEDRIRRTGWSLTELAARAGVNRTTAARWRTSGVPYHVAGTLVRQADGEDAPPAHALDVIARLAAHKVRHTPRVDYGF